MKKAFSILLVLGIVSCHVNYWDDNTYSDACADSFTVSMTDALQIASSFMTGREVFPLTRTEDLLVKSSFSIKDKKDEPLLHVVNYDGGGFAIIAGDIRLKPIQAYSSTGYFNDKIESYPLGLKIWIDCAEMTKEKAIENGGEIDVEIRLAWMDYKPDCFDSEKIKTRSLDPIEGPPHEDVDTLVGPLIQDSWHQHAPYNDSLLVCNHYSYTYFPPPLDVTIINNEGLYKPSVGCVPLAIARVLRYNQIPNNYSWSSMPNSVPQTIETVSFIRDVHYAVKDYSENHGYGFRYILSQGHSMVGVSDSLQIEDFLCDQYDLPAVISEPFSYGTSGLLRREMIDYQLPCIFSGSTLNDDDIDGHTWVCDGYHYHFLPRFGPDGEFLGGIEYKFLHHRWGWDSCDGDGWFSQFDFSVGDYDFFDLVFTHRISELDNWNIVF